MQLKWLRVLLPKMEDLPGRKSFSYTTSEVSVRCGTGRKQTARKTIGIKSYLGAKKQQSKQNLRISKERIEICDHVEGCGKEINEMLMFCVKCKDIQQFSFAELQEHCQQKHPEDKPVFVCSRCGFTVDDVEQMNVHAISHKMDHTLHSEHSESKEDQSSSMEGKLHKMRHLKPDTLYCNKCRFSTKDPLQFQKHILRHEEIQYKCGRCDRVCYTRGEFQRHSVQHTGTFPFKCRYCDYGAVRKDYVVKHTKGVHRDIIKNGGSVLVLPMRKGHKKKAFSKLKNVLKVKRTAIMQNENSANVCLHDQMADSAALAPNPNSTSCQVQDLDVAVLPQTCTNSTSVNESVDTTTVEYTKYLNCSPTDARKIQLQVLASSKHTVQPGTPLTLVAPAQVVIPSNCLAQLIEIKTVNGKQQLVFKLIPQVSAASGPVLGAGASGTTTLPLQGMQHVNTEIAQPQKYNMLNHLPTLLTKIELPQVGPLNEVVDADQKSMGIKSKMLFSNPPSPVDTEPMASNTSILESRNKASPKQNRSVVAEQLQSRESTEADLSRGSQQNHIVSPDVLGEAMHCLQRGAIYSKTTVKDLNADTQEILSQIDEESLTFEKPFVQLSKAVPVLPNKSMLLCDSELLIDSSCKTAIKSVETLPTDGPKANAQLCITSRCTPHDVGMASLLQISPTLSSNYKTLASKNSNHQITPNCSSVKQARFVPKSMFHTEYLKCQRTGIVDKQPTDPEACKSSFENHSMSSAAVQNRHNVSASCLLAQDHNDVHRVSNSYPTLGKCENSRKKPDLPFRQLNALEHKKINANDDEIKSGYCNQSLVTKIHDQNLQKNAIGPSSEGAATNSLTTVSTNSSVFMSEMLSQLHDKSKLTREEFSFVSPDIQYAQDSSQDIAITTDFSDFSNKCDLDTSKPTDDPSVDTQWPIISSVFSLSCGTNDVPESIRWDNDQDHNCTSFTSAQEILKANLCSQSQANSKSLINCLEKQESNKSCQISESLSHKNPVCVSKSGNRDLNATSVISGSPFQLSSGNNLAECLSLLPPLAPMPPILPVEIQDRFSANQFDDNAHMIQRTRNLYSSEFSLNQSSSNVCLGLSPTSNNNTAVDCSTQTDSFVQRIKSNTVPSSAGNPLTAVTQNYQTKLFSHPKLNVFPNLSPGGVSFQNKSLPNTLSSGIDGLRKPSVSHNFSSTFLITSDPSEGTPNVFEQQVSTSGNSQIAVQNQSPVALAKICEPNTSSSEGHSFRQNVCQSSEELQADTPITSVTSSLKVCHQFSLQNKVSLFLSSCNLSAIPKNVSSTDAVEKLEGAPYSLGQTELLKEKVTLPSTVKLQRISLSTPSVADKQSNHTKDQLKPPSKINKIHSVLPPSVHQIRCFHKTADDMSNQTEYAVDLLVNSQNAAEIENIVPNSPCENGSGNDNMGQDMPNLHFSQLQSKSEMSPLRISAFPLCSTKRQINVENTPPPHYLVKDTDCSKHETTYKVVPSGIVLRVFNAADDSKQKTTSDTVSCQSINQSQNLNRVLCATPISLSMAGKLVLQTSTVTKKQKICAKPDSRNNCTPKAKYQENSNCDQSSVSVDRPNTCNTISVKAAARHKSRLLKSSAAEQLPLKRRNTRKRKSGHIQDDILLKKIKKQDCLVPVVTDNCEILKTARKLRLKPFSESQLVKCPRRNQPVVVLNHPDVDVQEVVNVMQTIGKYRGHVLKVVLSERTVISLNLKKKHQKQEFGNRGISLDKWYNCKVVSPVKERHMLKMKLKKIHKNNYQIVKNVQNEHLQFKFHCWFCGRMFCDQEEWIAHGQRHLMEATRDWNDVTTIQETTESEAEVLNVKRNPI
ncbi:uncharacterized protein [Heptranchias perlo]|uniref:uncharacterized protein n=1 Tax=Heptranchias perlo TaxID=212740 RepID=UPI00355A473F